MSEFMMQKYLEINNWIESLKREEGQTLTEYALLLVLIAIVVVTAVTLLGGQIETVFKTITDRLQVK
jgi:pilus assembly protein Flp/PilA